MTPQIIGAVVRSVLTTLGGTLIGQGLITAEQINTISGAVVVLITLGWSLWQKKKAGKPE